MSFSSPDATVRGSFDLTVDSALRGLTSIRERGAEADTTLERLGRRLDELGRKVSRPRLELQGFDRVNAQLSEIELRLDRLDRRRATAGVGLGGGFSGGGGGGVGPSAGGTPLLSSLGGVGGRLPWWAAALPFAPALLGGAAGLVGSAGSAALGAGTVGLGGLGMLAPGAGLTLAVAKPAVAALGEIAKAQQHYNTVIAEYGRNSAQAATAARALNAQVAANPLAAGASRQLGAFRSAWGTATGAARGNVYGGISGTLYNARRAVPTLGYGATAATGAVAGAATSFSGFLAQPAEQAMLLRLSGAFAQNLPIAERSLENIVTIFGHLAVDALPFFREANVWVENWTTGLAARSANTGNVTRNMQTMAQSAKDWAGLLGAGARTLRDIFSAGRPSGDSMVMHLTDSINTWDRWIQNNPTKVRQFFSDSEASVSRIATVIGNLVADVAKLMNYLQPIFSRAEQFITFASGLGGGNLALGGALLYGGYEGIRGAVGGRGPSAGRALSSFVFGPSARGMGGGGGGGATTAAAAVSPLGRASAREVQAGVTRSGTFLMGPVTSGPQAVLARRAAAGVPPPSRLSRLGSAIGGTRAGAAGVDALGAAGGVARGLVAGASRFVLPLLGIEAALAAAQPTDGGGIAARLQNATSAVTLGLLPGYTGPNQQAARSVSAFVGGLPYGANTFAAEARQAALDRGFVRTFGSSTQGEGAATAAELPLLARLQANTLAQQAGQVQTPAQAAHVRQLTAQVSLELLPSQRAKFQTYLQQIATTASKNAGSAASNMWETAFTTGLQRGMGPQRAVSQMLGGIGSQVRALGPTGARAFARDTAQWVSQLEANNPKLQRPLERLMAGITWRINQMNKATGKSFEDLQRKVFYFNGQILTGTQTTWGVIARALTDPVQVAQEKLLGIFGTIQRQAINAVKGMGFTQQQAKAIVTATSAGGRDAAAAGFAVTVGTTPVAGLPPSAQHVTPLTQRPQRERGGMLGGTGLLDTVALPDGSRAAPGEAYIANRHTMLDLTRATLGRYGKTAWQMIRDERRPHSAPMQTGGGMSPTGHPELRPGISAAVASVLGMFPGLAITSTTRGGHAAGSYHYLGEAADLSSDAGTMYRASSWINSSGLARSLTEGIHNPNLSVKYGQGVPPSLWGPAVWAQHLNHIHMAVAGALNAGSLAGGVVGGGGASGMMASPISLHAPPTGMRGVPGALLSGAGAAYAAGLQSAVNKRTGATGISGAGFSGGGSSSANQTLGYRMMLAAGWPASQWPALQALWNQESGWSSTAVNPTSGAAGIPQALGHGHPFALGDAPAQIAWGLNYIRGRYGSPAAAEAHERANNWYATGGRVNWAGWNAKGANFAVNSPTLFGAGDKGREHVSITPAGKAGRPIQITFSGVTFYGGGRRELESIAEQVASKIIDALDGTDSGSSDRELMGAQ